jgi:putative membrane protein
MEYLILILKGMIIGIANIIPGVSGGTLMITLGIYQDVIETISHFFKNIKKSLKLVIPIGIGMILSILILSKIISVCLEKFPYPTTFFFIGLIIGGIPLLWKKVSASKYKYSNWLVFLITFGIILTFAFLKSGDNVISLENMSFTGYLGLFLVGMLSAATMVIPGISGSFVLMLVGYYEPIVNTIKDLTNMSLLSHNLLILIPFGLGIVIGIILVAKLIEWLLNKYPIKTYYGVLGFVIASIISIIMPLLNSSVSIIQVIISIILLIVGGIIAYKLGDK